MKTKSNYLIKKLPFHDLNECLIFLGHERQTNKTKAQSKLESVEMNLSENEYICLVDFIEAMDMIDHNYKLNEILPFCKRDDLVKMTKKIYLTGYIEEEDLEISNDLTQLETINNFESLIEDLDDDYLAQLLIEINKQHGDIVLSECQIPEEVQKSYILNLLGIKTKKQKGDEILLSTNYNPELLNLKDKEPQEFIEILKKVHNYLDQQGPKEFYSYAVIFEGESGTGKTEFAKYIANSLGKYFIHLSYGSLSSGYAGDTESNIKKMFEDAKNKKALIFLDEADSFLFNRNSAIQDFQVSIVNEVLQQIEKYPGIVICSTNFLGKIDKAALRRFPEKIQFDYLKNTQAQFAFENYFKKPLTLTEVNMLNKVKDLSLGDFKAVRQKTFFDEKIDNLKLINLLQLEVDYRSRIEL